jgi:hypothetical protein
MPSRLNKRQQRAQEELGLLAGPSSLSDLDKKDFVDHDSDNLAPRVATSGFAAVREFNLASGVLLTQNASLWQIMMMTATTVQARP